MSVTDEEVVARLKQQIGQAQIQLDESSRLARHRDRWAGSFLMERSQAPVLPLCVVRPRSTQDVVEVVNACRETATPLIPYGLGSGVCGGVLAQARSVVLDMGALNSVHGVDERNLLGCFPAGVRGSDAEAAVARRGLSLGHFPQSIDVSTVGGWVATRAAGQFSTGYGSIEDRIVALQAVLPDGNVLSTKTTPRASVGPDLKQLLLGSEGTLGVITEVTLGLVRKPQSRELAAFYLPTMAQGFELQRSVLQAGLRPVVLRQYDAPEVARLFRAYHRGDDALLLAICEGNAALAKVEIEELRHLAQSAGAEPAPIQAVEQWLQERNHVPDVEKLLNQGLAVDTIEVASTWDHIDGVYAEVIAALRGVEGIWNGSGHSSHAYITGLNLYSTFAAQPKETARLYHKYQECWQRVMNATVQAGGGIAHHHGIGRVRRAWLETELGPSGLQALRAVKRALDPVGFMNPGVLFPD